MQEKVFIIKIESYVLQVKVFNMKIENYVLQVTVQKVSYGVYISKQFPSVVLFWLNLMVKFFFSDTGE